jgi:pimeloyl-ACP methyl ester carboxylesterase
MKQNRISQFLLWLCFAIGSAFAEETRLYSGEIQVPSLGALNMTLGVSVTNEGTVLLLTVPAQNAENIPLTANYTKEGAISAELPQAGLSFVVFENDDRTLLTGEMHQGLVFEINFTRVDEIAQLVRPQNPEGPFPYDTREVTALHPEGHLLQGTLTIPSGRGPFPCAVLISGSGQQDRDESLMGHKPFLIIADYLSRRGIAVLRYDDRGVGGSVMKDTNDLKDDTSEDFATDANVMVHAARIHLEIDSRRVGVIGHSEGGLIGPMVALHDDKLAFVVMLAGPGVIGYELLGLQQGLHFESAGANKEIADKIVHASLSMYEMMQDGANNVELLPQMEELVSLQLAAQELQFTEAEFAKTVEEGLEAMALPWLQFFLFYDPLPTLEKVSCPVLAMNGTKDMQVSARQNLTAIESLKTDYGNDITIVKLEGLNHLFQPAITGAISEYSQIETTFDPEALQIMGEWIKEITDGN